MGTRSIVLTEVGDGCHGYLQGNGGWGWSNAGLIVGDGASLLVDTLFDPQLTAAMLDTMSPLTRFAPIDTLVNTHANGDHCYGNQLVDGATIVASAATAEEMPGVPPAMMAGLIAAPSEVGELFRSFFGDFNFEGIKLRLPDQTFSGRLSIDVGGRSVELIEVGGRRRVPRPRPRLPDPRCHRTVPQDGRYRTGVEGSPRATTRPALKRTSGGAN